MHINQLIGFQYIGSFLKSGNEATLGKLHLDPAGKVFWALSVGSEVMFISYLDEERRLSERLHYIEYGNGKGTYNRIYNEIMKLPEETKVDIYIRKFDSIISADNRKSELDAKKNSYKKLPWDR